MLVDIAANEETRPPGPAHAAPGATGAHGAELARLSAIHKSYLQGAVTVPALNGVDIAVAQGEMLAICGPSGSGKSTLLNIIGLLDEPTTGEVIVAGQRVLGMSANARADLRRAALGFIFQSFNLVPVLSALENVLLPLRLRGRVGREAHERARELLARVGLASHMQARPDRMSGGQRQRVAVARALVGQPRLVVADEPTANLDTENSMVVMDLIASLRRELGTTFVFSTHDSRILGHMTRIVPLRDGRLGAQEH